MARPSDWIIPGIKLSVTLDRYQELMRLPPAAFNGLNREEDKREYECPEIWNEIDRDNLALNLAAAQEIRERELGYHLAPTYKDEEVTFSDPIILKRKHLIKIGEEVIDDVDDGVALTYRDAGNIVDPVVFTVTVDFTDPAELIVRYPGEEVEITTSSVTISGTTATVKILRSRLVKPEIYANYHVSEHPRYDNDANFLETVDVKRKHYRLETGAYFKWMPGYCGVITETTQLAYPKIDNHRLGIILLQPATFADDVWSNASLAACYAPTHTNLRYVSGIQKSTSTEMLTARLSHVQPWKLSPCTLCWKNDVEPHPSKSTTPYGYKVAAVEAWLADSRAKVGHGGMFR